MKSVRSTLPDKPLFTSGLVDLAGFVTCGWDDILWGNPGEGTCSSGTGNIRMSQISKRRSDYPRPLVVCLALLAILAMKLLPAVAASRNADSNWTGRSDFGAAIAIADFDGDERPDMATVSVGRTGLQNTEYFIQFQLSREGDSDFGLTARGGGLDLSPRDVNGDSILDLVVSTSLDSKIVAVLLNDGHGRFSLVGANAYPALTTQVFSYIRTPFEPSHDLSVIAALRLPFGEEPSNMGAFFAPKSSRFRVLGARKRAQTGAFLHYPGRSPPILEASSRVNIL